MTKNLETADTIVKLILAILVILFYFADVISGPFAKGLMILAIIGLSIFAAKFIISKFLRD